MRNIIALGVLTGVAAASPVIYQKLIDHADLAKSQVEQAEIENARIMAAKAPQKAQLSGRTARIEADQKGHFNTQFKFNGRRIEGLIDTGATVVAINLSTARKIGVSLTASDFKHRVSTANGEAKAAVAMIDVLEVGRIRLEGIQAMVLEDKALQSTLVGMNVLNRLARYKVEGKVLVLEQ